MSNSKVSIYNSLEYGCHFRGIEQSVVKRKARGERTGEWRQERERGGERLHVRKGVGEDVCLRGGERREIKR